MSHTFYCLLFVLWNWGHQMLEYFENSLIFDCVSTMKRYLTEITFMARSQSDGSLTSCRWITFKFNETFKKLRFRTFLCFRNCCRYCKWCMLSRLCVHVNCGQSHVVEQHFLILLFTITRWSFRLLQLCWVDYPQPAAQPAHSTKQLTQLAVRVADCINIVKHSAAKELHFPQGRWWQMHWTYTVYRESTVWH